MKNLNLTDITEIRTPSKQYPAAAYNAIVTKFTAQKKVKGYGNLEADFVGVKPQHVVFMLKKATKDDESLTVTIHANHGVCLVRNETATTPADETA